MLDTETKRRINTCRDILVGKVPDPKSQVEQITVALIYKFMDDMDLESEEMGGARTFFANEYERYAWAKLVAPGVGGQEMLNIYTEALTKMVENPGIPELFRTIFRNAYLPYRDPETLRSFLREIDGFTYDHSERLGDAFEYLLSVLGSQGDAGQFRTPRHIIDFMVEIIDPKKGEVILDPACGTAGFLISSYKHILKANSTDVAGGDGNDAEMDAAEATLDSPLRYKGDLLTPEDKERLANNIEGYDISPDMVRLSLVNLYLHGFADPKVEEYDTLTSDDKWGETADVILANPPFMSPKGGIKPHNRFQVASKRSEVLFVDYMAEHLNPNGRAAIVVPEGIIFQSQSAYCELRRMLVEGKYLAAVISLPAGVFNPYSNVKTSILLLDRGAAKTSDSIAFFKIDNDGFGLGAQRRAVKGSQLPQVKAELAAWLVAARLNAEAPIDSSFGYAVPKKRIAESETYILSGERYQETLTRLSYYPFVALGDVLEIQNGFAFKADKFGPEGMPVIRIRDIKPNRTRTMYAGEFDPSYLVENGDLLVGMDGEFNSVIWAGDRALLNQRVCKLHSFKNVLKAYVARLLPVKLKEIEDATYAVTVKHISAKQIKAIQIPLPPLELQHEFVAEVEGYQNVIDGARAVIENYRPYIPIDPAWPVAKLGDICTSISDGDHQPPPKSEEGVPFITISNLDEEIGVRFDKTFFVPMKYYEALKDHRKPKLGDILYSVTGSYGVAVTVESESLFCFQRHIALIRPSEAILPAYLLAILRSPFGRQQGDAAATGVAQKTVSLTSLRDFKIPLPSLETQLAIVDEIAAEQVLVAANRELIVRFQAKIEQAIARVWGGVEEAAERAAA